MIISMTAHFIAIALLIQGLEIYLLSRKKSFLEIWSYENLKYDLEPGLPLPVDLIEFLFADHMVRIISIIQVIAAVAAFLDPKVGYFIALTVCHLLMCIRFRGTFNGGSDMMTFVLLTGMLIVLFAPTEKVQNLGFIYITINLIYSYLKAGRAKIKQDDWRKGIALPAFLNRSLYADTRTFGNWLQARPKLSLALCWFVMLFELAMPTVFLFPQFVFVYFLGACVFHTVIFSSFGLNRFFWVWLAAWPSVFYSVGLVLGPV